MSETTVSQTGNVKERRSNQFGHPDGPDPSAAGRTSRPTPSLVNGLKKRLREDPSIMEELITSWIDAARGGDATAVNALRMIGDRLDGPVKVEMDLRSDVSHFITEGVTLDMVPLMPEEVQELEGYVEPGDEEPED